MKKKLEWKERKISLGGAIVVSAVFAVVGVFVGANWKALFGGNTPYLGFGASQSVDWSALDEVYDKLATTYNGEVNAGKMIEGAEDGMV